MKSSRRFYADKNTTASSFSCLSCNLFLVMFEIFFMKPVRKNNFESLLKTHPPPAVQQKCVFTFIDDVLIRRNSRWRYLIQASKVSYVIQANKYLSRTLVIFNIIFIYQLDPRDCGTDCISRTESNTCDAFSIFQQ